MTDPPRNSPPATFPSLEDRFAISIEGGKIILTPKSANPSLSDLPSVEELAAYDKFLPEFSKSIETVSVPDFVIREIRHERTREYLSVILVVSVAITTLASVVFSFISGSIPSFIPLLLSPLTAICGAVVGFYFGGRRE